MALLIPVALVALAIFFISILLRLLKAPIKWLGKLVLHALLGYAALFVFNFVGAWVGISIGVNWINAVVTGVLGVPGVVLLLLIKYIF